MLHNTRVSETDSMLASVSDPQRAPEEAGRPAKRRRWRFYDHFRTGCRVAHNDPHRLERLRRPASCGSNLAAPFSDKRIRSEKPWEDSDDALPRQAVFYVEERTDVFRVAGAAAWTAPTLWQPPGRRTATLPSLNAALLTPPHQS